MPHESNYIVVLGGHNTVYLALTSQLITDTLEGILVFTDRLILVLCSMVYMMSNAYFVDRFCEVHPCVLSETDSKKTLIEHLFGSV